MPILIKCPACKAPDQISDDKRGQILRCGKCAQPFSVPAAIGTQKPAQKDAIQESRKVNAASSRKRDDHDATDDRGNRPVRTRKAEPAKGGVRVLLAVGGVAAVLSCCVLGAGGIGVVYLFRARPPAAEDNLAKAGGQKGEQKKPDNPGEQKKDPFVDPDAGKPLPPQLAPDLVAKVKLATVYLHVTMPSGVTAEGSGFFAVERGIIVTNAHVLGMMLETSRDPKQVDVVQDSGLATEARMVGEVLGVDRVSDLAVIRVPDNGKLPTPLTLSGDAPSELQKVYIFGFPFGEKLGKNITISEQAITSLRPDKSGGLDQIQVNGGMNPGNSGGPVVDTRGNPVGVSVSIITGAQISFAVPAEKVRRVMEGRVTDHQHGDAFVQQGGTRMPVRLKCLDPLNRIRDMRVEVWTGPPGAPRPRSNEKPQDLPGEGPRHEHAVKYAGGVGAVDVPLPPLPAGHVWWVQPVLTSAKGTHWGAALATTADVAALERKPANLIVDLDKHRERTARVDSRLTIVETFGKKEKKTAEHTTVELLERVEPEVANGKKSAAIKTAVGKVIVRVDVDGKDVKFERDELDALAISRGMAPTFLIDDTNATAGYRKTSMGPKHPKIHLKTLVELFNGMVNNPFEATQFKMPNKLVQPQESFTSQSTMMMRIGGAAPAPKGKPPQTATIFDLKMNCTLEGVRVRNGREEAVLTVVGALETRKNVPNKTLGDITGKIGFDIAGGFVSSAKVKIFAEAEETIPGFGTIRESASHDIELDRKAGHTLPGVAFGPDKGAAPVVKGKTILSESGILAGNDQVDGKTKGRMKVHLLPLEAGKEYVISLNSNAFDAYLRLLNPMGAVVAEDDDSGGNLNARITYRAAQTGQFRIIATSFDGKLGPYQLTVVEVQPPDKGPITKENKEFQQAKDPVPGGGIGNPAPNEFLKGDVTLRHFTFDDATYVTVWPRPIAASGVVRTELLA